MKLLLTTAALPPERATYILSGVWENIWLAIWLWERQTKAQKVEGRNEKNSFLCIIRYKLQCFREDWESGRGLQREERSSARHENQAPDGWPLGNGPGTHKNMVKILTLNCLHLNCHGIHCLQTSVSDYQSQSIKSLMLLHWDKKDQTVIQLWEATGKQLDMFEMMR